VLVFAYCLAMVRWRGWVRTRLAPRPGRPGESQVQSAQRRGQAVSGLFIAHRTMINGSALCAALAVTERD
jgi:hypothetical protein